MLNPLTPTALRMETGDTPHATALSPRVYAVLMRVDVEACRALRPHQHHVWHAFLIQLETMALKRKRGMKQSIIYSVEEQEPGGEAGRRRPCRRL